MVNSMSPLLRNTVGTIWHSQPGIALLKRFPSH
jgi:hypothetical protein